MGFRNNAYATVWESKPGKGNYNDLKLQISRKNQQTNQYEQEFSGWVRFVGKAKDLGLLPSKTRIKLLSTDVTNHFDREKNQMYWNPVVFEAELADGSTAPTPKEDDFINIPDGIDEEVPFI